MNKFEYKDPYLYEDKANKKWCVRYSIRYAGEKNYIPLKEYGKSYPFPKPLNSIVNHDERRKEFQKLLLLVEMDLKKGIILKQPETLKVLDDKAAKEASKKSYDECLKSYMIEKGYINPIPKKERSAEAIESFHRNQFRPFLERKKLLGDISKIGKAELMEFTNYYLKHPDPKRKWSNTTYTIKKALLSTFFSSMVDNDIIDENPAKKLKSLEKESTERFELFTIEERDILFNYLDSSDKKNYPFLSATCKSIYYSYIRETELSRLKVSDFNFQDRTIRIHPDNAKGQRDKKVRFVKMTKELKAGLETYLSKYEHQPNYFMFGKKFRPSQYRTGTDWTDDFKDVIDVLKIKHPGKFNREGLSPYAMKHSGVTHFIEANKANYSTSVLYGYVQKQCRHERFATTEIYYNKKQLNDDLKGIPAMPGLKDLSIIFRPVDFSILHFEWQIYLAIVLFALSGYLLLLGC